MNWKDMTWKEKAHKSITMIANCSEHKNYRGTYHMIYGVVEFQCGIDLEELEEQYKTWLESQGAKRKEVDKACKLDIVYNTPEAREVFEREVVRLFKSHVIPKMKEVIQYA
jgi:hypothetical protein